MGQTKYGPPVVMGSEDIMAPNCVEIKFQAPYTIDALLSP